MNTTPINGTLRKLSDSDETIGWSTVDIRGRHVKDASGKPIGKVHDLLIDEAHNKVRFLIVEHGGFLGFGDTMSFIPVDAITRITDRDVYIEHSGQHVAGAPVYDPKLVADREYHASISSYYGHSPYWGTGYSYPPGLATLPMREPRPPS